MKASVMRRLLNLWPPFLFTGIRIARISPDFHQADVTLTLRWYNRNYVGTHFGGSLFAMTDAMYALMLAKILGKEYTIWDQSASIDFLTPGRGVVTARFRLDDAVIQEIRDKTAGGEKYLPQFVIDVTGEQGEIVARVVKTVYVRKRKTAPEAPLRKS
jgi:acyl-coenzyme A thioesterase PaaI-like protein